MAKKKNIQVGYAPLDSELPSGLSLGDEERAAQDEIQKTAVLTTNQPLTYHKEDTLVIEFNPVTAIHYLTPTSEIQIDFVHGASDIYPTTTEDYAQFEECFSHKDWQKRATEFYAEHYLSKGSV